LPIFTDLQEFIQTDFFILLFYNTESHLADTIAGRNNKEQRSRMTHNNASIVPGKQKKEGIPAMRRPLKL
jgi:hypothetical protein